ncbi:MAG TPA: hypothetical protein VFM25_08465 [Verrucomicrobiae bacterium]|nr:hypothetical protein [Verrucomicrobiae bacterium]
MKIKRTTDTLAVTIDTNDLEFTNIIVGTNMVTGFHGQLFIYPIEESKPTHWNRMLEVGRNYDWGMGTSLFHTKADGIPQSNKSYVVEMELSAFETDMPPQHNWSPYGKNYKIIWQRNLKQIVK